MIEVKHAPEFSAGRQVCPKTAALRLHHFSTSAIPHGSKHTTELLQEVRASAPCMFAMEYDSGYGRAVHEGYVPLSDPETSNMLQNERNTASVRKQQYEDRLTFLEELIYIPSSWPRGSWGDSGGPWTGIANTAPTCSQTTINNSNEHTQHAEDNLIGDDHINTIIAEGPSIMKNLIKYASAPIYAQPVRLAQAWHGEGDLMLSLRWDLDFMTCIRPLTATLASQSDENDIQHLPCRGLPYTYAGPPVKHLPETMAVKDFLLLLSMSYGPAIPFIDKPFSFDMFDDLVNNIPTRYQQAINIQLEVALVLRTYKELRGYLCK